MELHLPTLLLCASAAVGLAALAMTLSGLGEPPHRGGKAWLAAQWLLALAMVLAPLREAVHGLGWLVNLLLLQWPVVALVGMRHFEARMALPASQRVDLLLLAAGALAASVAQAAVGGVFALVVFSLAACVLHLYVAAVLLAPPASAEHPASRAPGLLFALTGALLLARLMFALDAPAPAATDAVHSHALTLAMGAVALAFLCLKMTNDRGTRDLRESRQRLKVLANIDMLTRVPNRRHFMELARRVVERDGPGSASVLMFDIDHFKRINDVLGHAAGDRALRLVSRCAQDVLRQQDVAGRHGGDEFALLLPRTSADDAMGVAARIVAKVQTRAEQNDVPRLSLSFGVVQLRGDESLDDALRRADQALYEAKRQGRGRVVMAEGDEEQPVFSESKRLGLTPN
jgi:diguanylate cyclase